MAENEENKTLPIEEIPEKKVKKSQKQKKALQVTSFMMLISGVILFLSIISYTAADEVYGELSFGSLFKIFVNDPILKDRAANTNNWLGLFGAYFSNTLINNTIGYFSIIIPIILVGWGWFLIHKKKLAKIIYFTNYTIIISLLLASLFAYLRELFLMDYLSPQWNGVVGMFLTTILIQFVGKIGTGIILSSSVIILFVLLIDMDINQTIERIKNWFINFNENVNSKVDSWKEKRTETKNNEDVISVNREEVETEIPKENLLEEKIIEEKPIPQKVETEKILDENLTMDIHESIQEEEEVELDEREVEDEEIDFVFPSVELLETIKLNEQVDESELKANAELLKAKLADFDVEITSVSVTPGPVVTLYEVVPATGVKIAKITSLANDLALALQARGIRIIAPMPGKGTVGVEIPNHTPSIVSLRSVINSSKFRDANSPLTLAFGKTISGEVFVEDLSKMPHLLIAGSTGSGKSVCINTLIMSLIYKLHPSELKFVLIDPKKIELSLYKKLSQHYLALSKDLDQAIVTDPQSAVLFLKAAELEMEKRYDMLAAAGVRSLIDYNSKVATGKLNDTEKVKHKKLPYLIIIIDELADLMITAAREVEEPIARLAQLARAVGIHLVLATQRPSVDVITGVIKANFPARIAFVVSSKTDSRTILDMNGAEQLLGNGDMLYLAAGSSKPIRIQNAFISSDEVESIVNHIGKQKGYLKPFELPSVLEKQRSKLSQISEDTDELFNDAARVVVQHQQGSVSLLQRRLKIGYSRAARLIDELEAAGIVSQPDGSKARDVLVETESQLEIILKSLR
ncbi:MAG: DNA translocase FtsK 4TM domain-containing protein [Bacteroidetes bacterium]|nr:DNA translocase FtsK 4TM domain-containing protein [Bacteroidota bacterium]